MNVELLLRARHELIGGGLEQRHDLACALDRLEREPLPPGAEKVPGTRRLYRWQRGLCRILFIREGRRILVVSISSQPRNVPQRFRRAPPPG